MRYAVTATTVALLAALPAAAADKKPDGCYGTRVAFHDTPREAADAARKAEKLVFVLHVSGNFEDPRET